MRKSQPVVSREIKLLIPHFLSDWNFYLHDTALMPQFLAHNGRLILLLQQDLYLI